jgi:isopentenyldiphosphate isomerase
MAEEYLDIVDENGNLTGEKELRSICHEKGLWHQTVHIYVVRKNKSSTEFLVHLRSKNKSAKPNMWAISFGGHVEAGDSIEKTTEKELFEEIGIKVSPKNLIFAGTSVSYSEEKNKEYIYSFFYEFNGEYEDLKFNDGEVQAVRWRSLYEVLREIETMPSTWANSMNSYKKVVNMIPEKFRE